MNRKNYLQLQGWAQALLVVFFVIVLLYNYAEIDSFGLIAGAIMIAFFAYRSYSCFQALKEVGEEEMSDDPITTAATIAVEGTAEEQISYYQKIILAGAVAFPALSLLTWSDLNDLESGTVESVRLWAPFAFLYNIGGYWTAVLAAPVLGVVVIGLLIKKVYDLKNA